jgi:hypothetical protein
VLIFCKHSQYCNQYTGMQFVGDLVTRGPARMVPTNNESQVVYTSRGISIPHIPFSLLPIASVSCHCVRLADYGEPIRPSYPLCKRRILLQYRLTRYQSRSPIGPRATAAILKLISGPKNRMLSHSPGKVMTLPVNRMIYRRSCFSSSWASSQFCMTSSAFELM